MKKTDILFLILILLFSAYLVYATTVEIVEDTVADQSGTVGTWDPNHSLSNITDGNYTTYAVTFVNNTYAMINFTKEDGSGSSSKVQVTYNTSSGSNGTNYTLSDFPICWNNNTDKLLFRLASNFTQNFSNDIIFENITPIVTKVFDETITLLNNTAVALDNVNVIVNTLVVFNRTIEVDDTINESVTPVITQIINETITLLNDTAVALVGRNVIVNTLVIFNQTANLTSLNESGFIWLNNTNLTLANNRLTGLLRIYNCSGSSYEELANSNWSGFIVSGKVFMTSNATFADGLPVCINYSYWGSGYGEALNSSNYTLSLSAGTITLAETSFNNSALGVNYTYSTPITLANTLVINSTVRLFNRTANTTVLNESGFTWLNNTNLTLANNRLTGLLRIYNCSKSSYEELGSGNWTEFATDGKIHMTQNTTFADGLPVCINYSYWGSGYGEAVPDSNYSIDYLSGNLSILDAHWNETLGINYTYHSLGSGEALGVNNYTLDLTAGTIFLNDSRYNNTALGVNYTYSTPITLANTRVINSTVRLFNRTINTTVINESGFTWSNNTNLTLANDDLTGLLKIYNCSGDSYEELGSGNWTEFATDGKVFMTSNGTFGDNLPVCINYSYWGVGSGEAVPDSNYSIDYLSGNLSILDSKWNGTLGINYTFLNDSTEKNKKECYNGTDWILLDTESDQDEIFDIRMFWSLGGSEWIIDYYRVSPIGVTDVDYFPSTSTTVVFNLTANLTRSAGNQTTINTSLWIRIDNSSGIYTLNSSDFVLINTSYVNQTLIFAIGERIWYYWSFKDNQSRSIENTTVRIVDIVEDLEILSIGDATKPINFTLNTGDAVFRGDVTVNSLILRNISTPSTCSITANGQLFYNATDHHAYICNSTSWNALW